MVGVGFSVLHEVGHLLGISKVPAGRVGIGDGGVEGGWCRTTCIRSVCDCRGNIIDTDAASLGETASSFTFAESSIFTASLFAFTSSFGSTALLFVFASSWGSTALLFAFASSWGDWRQAAARDLRRDAAEADSKRDIATAQIWRR